MSGLDYSSGCVNFRDVGESLELITGKTLIPPGQIFRGGKIDFVDSHDELLNPATILNLRRGTDPKKFECSYVQIAASNDLEKYDTSNPEVRQWLNDVLSYCASVETKLPLLVHCTSGKDRTGVVVAAILTVIGIERSIIVDEYLLSDGDVSRDLIELAIDGFTDTSNYFHRVNLELIRKRFGYPIKQ